MGVYLPVSGKIFIVTQIAYTAIYQMILYCQNF